MFTQFLADLLAISYARSTLRKPAGIKKPRRSEVFCTAIILVFTKLFADLLAIGYARSWLQLPADIKKPRRAGFFNDRLFKLSACPVSRGSAG